MKEAKSYLEEPEKFNYALDIDSLRKRNENPVRPIALAVSAEEQPAPDVNEFVLQKAEKPEIRIQAVKQIEPEDSKAYAKQRYWEKKLLDVSLTNPLISIYKRRYVNVQDEQGNAFRIPKLYSNNLPIAWMILAGLRIDSRTDLLFICVMILRIYLKILLLKKK